MYTQNEYEELLRAYRLIGRTIFPTKGKRVEMRFETFYGAKYHETYYIVLDQNEKNCQLSIFMHTIPHFIPLKELENDYLNKDIYKFRNFVDDYLQAYVKRREEIKILQQNKGIINLSTNNVHDFIEFSVCLEKHTMKISIKYEDLKLCIPTNTVIYQIEEDDNNFITRLKRLRKLEKYFKETSLLKAFDNVFVDAS
ncbi:hypothetical protein Glove_104g58 [Diversispora epigaea]|uniref:Centromere protein O n=1 Tax=Diversispora epigaea TaxID=1348612 RepID=A0A397JDJ5_9GLOM|nr:hypothetical protein Glove_104g58 [Diversispora epigaea]